MTQDFFATLPAFDRFADVLDANRYESLPHGWLLAVTDIVNSTRAIADGRYKTVNFVGAAPISALANTLDDHDLPYVFGGDGVMVALPPDSRERAERALAACVAWADRSFGLELRAALIGVDEIRAAGHDIRIGRYRASEHVAYAMFAGGGGVWAETELKAGRLPALPPAPPGEPDLSGLSCRWAPMQSAHGVVLSLIAEPRDGVETSALRTTFDALLARISDSAGRGRPVPESGPAFRWPPTAAAVDNEARASHAGSLFGRRLKVYLITALARLLEIFNLKPGGFDARHYRVQTGHNADFRKYQDGLRMTLDCSAEDADAIEEILRDAAMRGVLRYGLHRQDAAIMTCIVISPMRDDHVHFVDGAGGGYARAAGVLRGVG